MKISGEKTIAAAPSEIWHRLLQPEALKRCVPGCEVIEELEPLRYRAVALIKVGPVSARFAGNIEIVDVVEFSSCRIMGKGSGGVAGFAGGEAVVRLEPHGDGTVLTYDGEVQIGGKIASLGDRLFRSIVDKNVESFFATLQVVLEQGLTR